MKADTFLTEIDGAIARTDLTHCCSVGCSHCCYEPAYASTAEIDDIVSVLTEEQKVYVKNRVQWWLDDAQTMLGDKLPDAFKWRDQRIACPLLRGGLCMVYPFRPMGCRTFFAFDHPENCQMPHRRHQKFAYWNPEVFAPAFFKLFGKNATLEFDHIGVLLAKALLGIEVESGAKQKVLIQGESTPETVTTA